MTATCQVCGNTFSPRRLSMLSVRKQVNCSRRCKNTWADRRRRGLPGNNVDYRAALHAMGEEPAELRARALELEVQAACLRDRAKAVEATRAAFVDVRLAAGFKATRASQALGSLMAGAK